MLTDQQVKRIKMMETEGKTHENIAGRVDVSRSSVEKYLKTDVLPSEQKLEKRVVTTKKIFEDVWDQITTFLETNPGLQVKTIFEELQKQHPDKFQDGQRRTLERNIRIWRAIKGDDKEVYFEQNHYPGNLCASDYTKMNRIKITIKGKILHHMLYHFVLTYSNWETITICYGETYESLSEGLQNALFELGGIPTKHRSDNLGAAVINMGNDKGEMTKRYNGLMDHYKMERSKIQPGKPNENGDVEKSNDLLKKAIEQQLMLRDSRDFESIEAYEIFLRTLLKQLNSGRSQRLKEELKCLRRLPEKKLDSSTKYSVTVSKHSTMRVNAQVYSIWSRLIGATHRINCDK